MALPEIKGELGMSQSEHDPCFTTSITTASSDSIWRATSTMDGARLCTGTVRSNSVDLWARCAASQTSCKVRMGWWLVSFPSRLSASNIDVQLTQPKPHTKTGDTKKE